MFQTAKETQNSATSIPTLQTERRQDHALGEEDFWKTGSLEGRASGKSQMTDELFDDFREF